MPAAANITVKKNDGTTDVIYSTQQGEAGDKPAVWYAPALGATAATRPELRISTKPLPNGKRRVKGTYMMPYSVLNSTTGVTMVDRALMGDFSCTFDPNIPTNISDEGASQLANLVASALVKAMFKEGQAAT